MYADHRPCAVCGAPVTLRERRAPRLDADVLAEEPVGPSDGVVGSGDPTTDERVCTNEQCPTRAGDSDLHP